MKTILPETCQKVKVIDGTTLIGVSDQSYQPTLSQLRAFVAVATYRHFGTAASRLNVSQPTLSQGLASLESGLGVHLIERSTRRVLVTPAGARLLAQAQAIVDAADGFVAAAAGVTDGLSGPLRLGLIPTVAPYVLPDLLPALNIAMPHVRLHVIEDHTARLLDALRGGTLDAAVVALPSDIGGVLEIPLYSEDFVLVVPRGHELAGREDLSPAALDEAPLLLLDEGHCLRDQTLDLCRSADVRPAAGDTRATSLATVVRCVAGGLGITLVPASAIPVETARGDLAMAHFASPVPGRTIGLVVRSSTARAADYRALADLIRTRVPAQVRPVG